LQIPVVLLYGGGLGIPFELSFFESGEGQYKDKGKEEVFLHGG
jgi:hypothetical protein